jgi:hypothetical protein
MPPWALLGQQHDRGSKPQDTHHQGMPLVCAGLRSGKASVIGQARFCKNFSWLRYCSAVNTDWLILPKGI